MDSEENFFPDLIKSYLKKYFTKECLNCILIT